LLIFGLGIGLFGQKWFLPITGGFGALCAFVAFMIMASIFQWLNTTVGLIICGIFAIASGVLAYWVLSTEQIATMFLCIGGGFMLGSVIEGLIIAISSWESMVFYLIITISCMVIGGLIGCKKPLLVQKYLTAIVGSYIFMRGWTYFLGGFPSEMEMYNMMAHPTSEELDFTGLFWFYVALWAAGVFFFIYVQSTWEYAKSSEDKKTTEANSGHYTH
jgi:MFS family permease